MSEHRRAAHPRLAQQFVSRFKVRTATLTLPGVPRMYFFLRLSSDGSMVVMVAPSFSALILLGSTSAGLMASCSSVTVDLS